MNATQLQANRTNGFRTVLPTPVFPRCARPGCLNPVVEAWDDSGQLCSRCALETDLFDRTDRWDRLAILAKIS